MSSGDAGSEKLAADVAGIEVTPDGQELLVAVRTDTFTGLVKGRTDEILGLARTILAAPPKWLPAELVAFARDIEARRPTKICPMNWPLGPTVVEATSDDELVQAQSALHALREVRAFVGGVFSVALERLKQEEAEWRRSEGPGSIQ